MEELYSKLCKIPDSYYAFVLGITEYCKKKPERLSKMMDFLNYNQNIGSSEVVEFMVKQPDYYEDEYSPTRCEQVLRV